MILLDIAEVVWNNREDTFAFAGLLGLAISGELARVAWACFTRLTLTLIEGSLPLGELLMLARASRGTGAGEPPLPREDWSPCPVGNGLLCTRLGEDEAGDGMWDAVLVFAITAGDDWLTGRGSSAGKLLGSPSVEVPPEVTDARIPPSHVDDASVEGVGVISGVVSGTTSGAVSSVGAGAASGGGAGALSAKVVGAESS